MQPRPPSQPKARPQGHGQQQGRGSLTRSANTAAAAGSSVEVTNSSEPSDKLVSGLDPTGDPNTDALLRDAKVMVGAQHEALKKQLRFAGGRIERVGVPQRLRSAVPSSSARQGRTKIPHALRDKLIPTSLRVQERIEHARMDHHRRYEAARSARESEAARMRLLYNARGGGGGGGGISHRPTAWSADDGSSDWLDADFSGDVAVEPMERPIGMGVGVVTPRDGLLRGLEAREALFRRLQGAARHE